MASLAHPGPSYEMHKRTLQLRKLGSTTRLGATVLESINIQQMQDVAYRDMLLSLEAQVLSDKIADDKYTAYFYWKEPLNWFEHWKKDHAPRWMKQRWPVQHKERKAKRVVKFTRWAQYPKANVALQRDKRFYEVTLGGFESLWDEVS